jgi:hypothetical protein
MIFSTSTLPRWLIGLLTALVLGLTFTAYAQFDLLFNWVNAKLC